MRVYWNGVVYEAITELHVRNIIALLRGAMLPNPVCEVVLQGYIVGRY